MSDALPHGAAWHTNSEAVAGALASTENVITFEFSAGAPPGVSWLLASSTDWLRSVYVVSSQPFVAPAPAGSASVVVQVREPGPRAPLREVWMVLTPACQA